MVKRSRKAPSDFNANAARIVTTATDQDLPKAKTPANPTTAAAPKKNPHAAAPGRRGGKARAKALTAEERRSIAVKAARARWGMEDNE